MPIAPLGPTLALWLLLMIGPVWLPSLPSRIMGCLSIAFILLFFNFPDIPDYKIHYDAIAQVSMKSLGSVANEWNFEVGYDWLVFAFSRLLPFELFYILLITFSLLSYYGFYSAYLNELKNLGFIVFVSIFIYYISFTLRTTIVSAMLASALVLIKRERKIFATVIIGISAQIHTVAIPYISIVLLSGFKKIINKNKWLAGLFLLTTYVSVEMFVPLLLKAFSEIEFTKFKINSYAEFSVYDWNLLIVAWVLIGLLIFTRDRYKDEDGFWLYIVVSSVFILLSFNSFFQGRATWAATFVYAYLIVSILRKYLKKPGAIMMACLIASTGTLGMLRFG